MIKMEPLKLLEKHCKFEDDKYVYVLLAVVRKKDNKTLSNSQEIVFREVIKKEDEIKRKYNKIKLLTDNYKDENGKKYNFYIYITVNPRDVIKATFLLKEHIDNWIINMLNGVNNTMQFKKLGRHWISSLMKNESRASRGNFLVDIDTKDKKIVEYIKINIQAHTKILIEQETKNGWHYVVKPFDIKKLEESKYKEYFEIKKDDLLFVECVRK